MGERLDSLWAAQQLMPRTMAKWMRGSPTDRSHPAAGRRRDQSPAGVAARMAASGFRLVRAVLAQTVGVQVQAVLVDAEAPLLGDAFLAALDLLIVELLHPAALHA